jgi:hypothetical protein
MSSHRLTGFFTDRRHGRFSFEIAALPQTAAPHQAFVACPVALTQTMNPSQIAWQLSVHKLAYEQARAAVAARSRARESAFLWN